MPESVYDDRLPGHETVDGLLDTAEEIVKELAQDHYSRCYGDETCGMCADDTPISGTNGSWMGMKSAVDNLSSAVEDRATDIDPSEDSHWVYAELTGVYLEAFHESAVEPSECEICLHDDEYLDCGHEINGEPCPAR